MAKDAWDTLKQKYRGDSQVRDVNLQGIRRDFEYARMRKDEMLSTYLTRMFNLINQMKVYDEELSNKRIVEKLLISLTLNSANIVFGFEGTKKFDEINPTKVVATSKRFEQKLLRHDQEKEITEKAFSLFVDRKDLGKEPSGKGRSAYL
ncbi:uncharacterized protein [Malus domestica]|uniref:uncharacterized protein n=1 Tax=Malus domestica TaxID=3750 RepID=UPI0010AA51A4|nr:uncharacterized protein LOC114822496 [Malus domestica]